MSEHRVLVKWERASPDFGYESYNRDHTWAFDGGVTVKASAAPAYRGNPDCVDPEERCGRTFELPHADLLRLASRKKVIVDAYDDDATGYMTKNAQGKLAIMRLRSSAAHPIRRFERTVGRGTGETARSGPSRMLHRQFSAD